MADRKVYVELKTRLIIEMHEGIEVSEVIQEMDHSYLSGTVGAEIVDSEIRDYEVTDSK
jgi:hypothetical protein